MTIGAPAHPARPSRHLGQEKDGRAAAYPNLITVAPHTKKDNPAGLPSRPSSPQTTLARRYVLITKVAGHLDTAYERQLEMLTRARRAVADAATSRKRLELQANRLEQQTGKLDDQSRKAMEAGRCDIAEQAGARRDAAREQRAGLQRQYADMQAEEERLTVASQRVQAKVDAFRIRKEAIKAAHAAAQAAAEVAWAEAVIDDADANAEGAGSAAGNAVNAESPDPARPSLPLSELRPGAPESADTRILFTIEPPGTAVLLAAGMEDDWLRAWYTEAIANCRIRYQHE